MSRLDQLQLTETLAVTNLGRLLARMALDEVLHGQYLADPAAVIAAAGLSAEESAALTAGDWGRIQKLLGPKRRPLHEEETQGGGSGG